MKAIIQDSVKIATDSTLEHQQKHKPKRRLLNKLSKNSWDIQDYLERLEDLENGQKESEQLRAHYGRLERFILQRWVREIAPDTRTASVCLRRTNNFVLEDGIKQSGEVSIHKTHDHDSVFYGNLQVCGSIWTCPVCSAKVTERRRKELQAALQQHVFENKGVLFMITRTVPHQYEDDISDMLGRFSKAGQWMMRQADFKGSKRKLGTTQKVGLIGRITALEVTYGFTNGWHPHTHELWLCDKFYPDILEDLHDLKEQWRKSAKRHGFSEPSEAHGCDIRQVEIKSPEEIADYVAKFGREPWGIDAEVTKLHCKNTKSAKAFDGSKEQLKTLGSLTPWDLMRLSLYWDIRKTDKLFKEYITAFKGSPQLRWSKGLKARFNIDKKTDEQLANEKIENAAQIAKVESEDWYRVLQNDARGILLALAKYKGQEAVDDLLHDFRLLEEGHILT